MGAQKQPNSMFPPHELKQDNTESVTLTQKMSSAKSSEIKHVIGNSGAPSLTKIESVKSHIPEFVMAQGPTARVVKSATRSANS